MPKTRQFKSLICKPSIPTTTIQLHQYQNTRGKLCGALR